tara:strand:- start:96 stop:566 length:471 start_codon:yes stop_codon:yes gene_type:complete
MIHWIFDLDNTLYRFLNQKKPDMREIYIDKELPKIIRFLPGNKLIFTNANHYHSMNMIHELGMYNCYSAVINRDILKGIKPDPKTYFKVVQWCNIQNNDKVIFFEDTPVNLEMAKKFGWITVLISNQIVKANYIDLCCPDVKTAIRIILKKILTKR